MRVGFEIRKPASAGLTKHAHRLRGVDEDGRILQCSSRFDQCSDRQGTPGAIHSARNQAISNAQNTKAPAIHCRLVLRDLGQSLRANR